MNKQNTSILAAILMLLSMYLVACDDDSSSDQPEEYKLDNYYQVAETGTWIYATYDDDELTHYDINLMKGETYKSGRDCFEISCTRLDEDSVFQSQGYSYYSIEDDSLFHLDIKSDLTEVWEVDNFISSWADEIVGDTITYQHFYNMYISATFKMVLAEINASITVDNETYSNCRVYEYYGISDETASSSIIVCYYAPEYGLVYEKSDYYLHGFDQEKTKTVEKKLLRYLE